MILLGTYLLFICYYMLGGVWGRTPVILHRSLSPSFLSSFVDSLLSYGLGILYH